MNILVIGGTYFLGKAFVEIACKDNNITILNRGTRQVEFPYPKNVSEIIADRHNLSKEIFAEKKFDVIVDFCAYGKGDIEYLVKALAGNFDRYIFISTSDVYKRETGNLIDENGEFETRDFGGDAGKYILGKVSLENELIEQAGKYGFSYNSLRPTFIYGADNYAGRESVFFEWATKASQVIFPSDATGSFQMVYVKDLAKAILDILNSDKCKDRAFNLCGDGIVTYDSFIDALSKAMGTELEKVLISVDEINERQLPLSFPLTKEESESYTTNAEELLNIAYTSLEEGLKDIYRIRLEREIPVDVDSFFDENNPKAAEEYMLNMNDLSTSLGFVSTKLLVLNELIGYYRQTSEKDKLAGVIDEALSIAEQNKEEMCIEYATTTLNAANAYRSLGKLDEAKKYYAITEEIYKSEIAAGRLLPDDLRIAGFYNNYALLTEEVNDYNKSIELLNLALRIVISKKAGFEIAVTYANLANSYLLAKDYIKAKEYAYTAIRLFKARGLKDPHYCAALSALAQCYFEAKDYSLAAVLYKKAMEIVENTIGKNSQYERLRDNLSKCIMENGGETMTGLELAKEYYEEYGKKMIEDKFGSYTHKIAIGLVGEGSECFGFDDELSFDHDLGPDFCIFVSDATYEKIGEELEKAYEELPKEYKGYKKTETPTGFGRRGVIKISDFYKKFLGTDKYEEIDYRMINDFSLAAATNGVVFKDEEGLFSDLRNKLLENHYPENIRLLKIAEACANFSQCAQYNYLRMLNREDEVSAQIMLGDGIKAAMKLYHYICNEFPPHDKWLYKSTEGLADGELITDLIDQVMNRFLVASDKREVLESIEKLGECLATIMYRKGIISDTEAYIDYHTAELVFKASIVSDTEEELVDKIVKLEFEAFDKVENEGGRAYCQNNWPTFSIMRKSQYLTWDKEMLIQYYYDFKRQFDMGHNLITEKYGRMMESTDEQRWNEIKENFPELSEEKRAVIEQIVGVQMQMMEEFAKKYPKTAGNARSLHTYEDSIVNTSYETYLRGEISTYSDKMLQLYGRYVVLANNEGRNIAHDIMENTAKLYKFNSIDEFENA